MKQKKISRNYLEQIPMPVSHHPWRVREDGMVEIDIEHKGFYNTIAQKFFHKPRISHIALDTYGSKVWQSMTNERTVYDIVQIMQQHFPNEKDRMLDRVVTYMATLERNKFIHMYHK